MSRPDVSKLLPTTVVGSYPQPDWLIDRPALAAGAVPRTRARSLWRVDSRYLEEAQDDATRLAIRDMEQAGIDVITDGEARRESYSNRFASALEGVDADRPAAISTPGGRITQVPRIVGQVRRVRPVEVRDMEFLRSHTSRAAKITLPGPFTMALQAHDEHYHDFEALVMDFAAAVNAEARDLVRAGADIIQLDEPWVRRDPVAARRLAVPAIDRALKDIGVTTAVHVCFGYAALTSSASKPTGYPFLGELTACAADQISIEAAQPNLDLGVLRELAGKTVVLGVLDLADSAVETAELVAARIRAALEHTSAERLVPAPDCGMKYLSRARAFAKLQALSAGAAIVRAEIA